MFNDFSFTAFSNNAFRKHQILFWISVALLGLCFLLGLFDRFYFVLGFLPFYLSVSSAFKARMVHDSFARENKLIKYFIISRHELGHKYDQMKKLLKSSQLLVTPIVWTTPGQEVQFAFSITGSVRCWFLLDNQLPKIIVDSKKNNIFRKMTTLNAINLPKQKVVLEGDFPEHFDIYYEDKAQVLALQILSPDFMAQLIDSHAEYDIEIYNNIVAMRSKKAMHSPMEMKNFLTSVSILRGNAIRVLNRIHTNESLSPASKGREFVLGADFFNE